MLIVFTKYDLDWTKIGRRISIERKARGFKNLDNFAEEISVSRQTLSKWEKGDEKTHPLLDDLFKMCNLFNCELGYLLCEYDCKTRAATDIQAITGLSEAAILQLNAWHESEESPHPITADIKILDVISRLIEAGGEGHMHGFYVGILKAMKCKNVYDGRTSESRTKDMSQALQLLGKHGYALIEDAKMQREYYMYEATRHFNQVISDVIIQLEAEKDGAQINS